MGGAIAMIRLCSIIIYRTTTTIINTKRTSTKVSFPNRFPMDFKKFIYCLLAIYSRGHMTSISTLILLSVLSFQFVELRYSLIFKRNCFHFKVRHCPFRWIVDPDNCTISQHFTFLIADQHSCSSES